MDKSAVINDINRFVEENTDRMLSDIARLVKFDTVLGEPEENAPFGKKTAECLEEALKMSEELGLSGVNCENMIGYAQYGEGDKDSDYIATITHLDVVPVGVGWTGDPFEMRIRDGYIIGRGVMDDKGPAVLCLYAMKYFKDRNISVKYPIRAILGINEETGMKDVEYYLDNYKAPLFCFSPDADFPMCNGEKGIYRGDLISNCTLENIIDIKGGEAANAIPGLAEAWVKADVLSNADNIEVEECEKGIWHITSHGVGGHASMPEGTLNAIGVLVDYILDNNIAGKDEAEYLKIVSLLNAAPDGSKLGVNAKDEIFQPLTIVGGVIEVKDGKIWQSLDSRYPTSTSGEKIAEGIRQKAGSAATVTCNRDTVPFYMSTDKPEVQVCLEAYRDITGEKNAEPYTIGGGTYARHFPNAVSFGPEHPERPQPDFAGPIHGADEGASIAFMTEALKIYILSLLRLEEIDF